MSTGGSGKKTPDKQTKMYKLMKHAQKRFLNH